MSSLQKLHRRTNNAVAVVSPFTTVGSGNDTVGYYVGSTTGGAKLIVAPISTEFTSYFGSVGSTTGTTSTSDGLTNTNTLVSLGGHPAAATCKSLTTGGYNTWYQPAIDELSTAWNSRAATPFGNSNKLSTSAPDYGSSTEFNANWSWNLTANGNTNYANKGAPGSYNRKIRAVRRAQ